MRPNLTRDRRKSWGALIAVLVVCGIALGAYYDWGASEEAVASSQQELSKLSGSLLLEQLVAEQRAINDGLVGSMAKRKQEVGLERVSPFVVSTKERDPRIFFQDLYYVIRDELKNLARTGSVKQFDETMGFPFASGKPPPDDPIEQWLTMLQMVTKACYLASQSRWREIESIRVLSITHAEGELKGSPGRAPILREFAFQMEVRGTLRDILWLMHEMSADELTKTGERLDEWRLALIDKMKSVRYDLPETQGRIGPLAMTGMNIVGGNLSAIDNMQELTVVFNLAGMQFLDQGTATTVMPGTARGGPAKAPRRMVAHP